MQLNADMMSAMICHRSAPKRGKRRPAFVHVCDGMLILKMSKKKRQTVWCIWLIRDYGKINRAGFILFLYRAGIFWGYEGRIKGERL